MDYRLKRKIYLNEEFNQILAKWSLEEIDENNNKIDHNLTPWPGTVWFSATSFKIVREIKNHEDDLDDPSKNLYKEIKIIGNLQPGFLDDEGNLKDTISYSMFGTDRKIKNFNISIYQNSSNEVKELYELGIISNYNIDNEWFELSGYLKEESGVFLHDQLELHLFLNKIKFNEFLDLIESKKIDTFNILLKGVRGFYSDWQPDYWQPNFIKILTKSHIIENSNQSEIQPKRLGFLDKFSIITSKTFGGLNLKN